MAGKSDSKYRLAMLCKKMGKMQSKEDEVNIEGDVFLKKVKERELTFLGKPNVNFYALLNIMKKAWQFDSVKCALLEPGYSLFIFKLEEEKHRVGKWSVMLC